MQFGLGRQSLARHAAHSTPVQDVRARITDQRLEAAAARQMTVLEKVRVLTRAGAPRAEEQAGLGELDYPKLLELEAKLSGELVKKIDATVTQGPQTPQEALDMFDRMRPALEAQAAEDAAGEKH